MFCVALDYNNWVFIMDLLWMVSTVGCDWFCVFNEYSMKTQIYSDPLISTKFYIYYFIYTKTL